MFSGNLVVISQARVLVLVDGDGEGGMGIRGGVLVVLSN